MKESKSKLFKQRLFRIHASAGIVFSLIIYISIFFGIFAILLPYIKQWEKPSRHFEQIELIKINYNLMLDKVLKDPTFPRNNILINLPGNMGDSALSITHRFVKPISFNPKTQEKLNDESSNSHLADFLNELHYGAPLKLLGRIIFGFVGVGCMALVITGLILIILMKFKNKGKNQQAIFSKIHVKIFTYTFPVLLVIILTGAIMNIGLISSGPMAQMLSNNQAKDIDSLVGPILFPRTKAIKKDNINVKMLPIKDLIRKAKEINPQLTFKQLRLINWKDKSAKIELIAYNPYKPFLNGGIFNKPSITLSAYSGKLIQNKKVLDNSWSVFVAEALFFLHFLFGIDIVSRVFITLIMLSCCIAIGFGVMLYLEKKVKKFQKKAIFYHWMGKLSLTVTIGIIPATSSLFILQWLLPFEMQDRILWQQGIFYNTWLFTLFWSFYRINSYKASKEFFYIGGLMFLVSPLIHLINSGYNPMTLFTNNITNILAVDIALFLFGILLILISKKLPSNRNEAKLFWIKKQKVIHE